MALQSNRGSKYESSLEEMYLEYNIIHQTIAFYSPQSNGIAERKNRMLKEMMNVLLISSDLPQNLWGKEILSDNRILSRVPHSKMQSIPYEKKEWKEAQIEYFKICGYVAKVQVPKPKKVKIRPEIIDCSFIGYATNSKAYRFLIHKSENSDIYINTVIVSDNAEFFENIYPYKKKCESSSEISKRPREEEKESTHNEVNPRRSKRQKTTTSFGPDLLTFLLESDPQTLKEAMLERGSQ